MMKKMCELCGHTARLFCDSDQANLCYDCDRKIHSANFLVTKHSRTLLCHTCQSPTPWIASGLDLGRAASICADCLHRNGISRRRNGVAEENLVTHDDLYEEGDGETEDCDGDRDEDGENQVVPWPSSASPPAAASSSTTGEFSSSRSESDIRNSAVKRKPDETDDAASSTSLRTLKVIRSESNGVGYQHGG